MTDRIALGLGTQEPLSSGSNNTAVGWNRRNSRRRYLRAALWNLRRAIRP